MHSTIRERVTTGTRATRQEGATNSSWATSTTASTAMSTVVTSTSWGIPWNGEEIPPARSKSHSPLTVHSHDGDTEPQCSLSGSTETSFLSIVPLAPTTRYFDSPLSRLVNPNRVVSVDVVIANEQIQFMNEVDDGVSLPDDFDNLIEAADAFETRSRL